MNNNGAAIANIAIKHALDGNATYTAAEIQPLKVLVADLEKIANRIDLALRNYLIANSIQDDATENTFVEIVNGVTDAANITAAEAVEGTVEPTGAAYAAAKKKLAAVRTAIETAKGINSLPTEGITWTQLSTPLGALVNTNSIKVNGLNMADIMADGGKDQLVQQIIKDKFIAKLTATTGSGVLADIADLTGGYKASFGIVVSYGDLKDVPVDADMNINTTVDPDHMTAVGALMTDFEVAGSAGGTDKPISSFYGYIIDLAFRTNASGSWLMLQQEGIDRIYEEGSDNAATMGHGANMTFKTDSATFGENGVKELMENIRIVFFNTKDTGGDKIVAYAKLDSTKATSSAAGVTMPIMLTTDGTYANAKTDDNATDINESLQIMQLTQNEAQALSVLVYLDGSSIQNADVAADAAQSMYGSMNLQFSSSANLVPMDYADLKTQGGTTSATISPLNNITLPGNGYKVQAYTDGSKIAFSLTGPNNGTLSDVKVKIGDAGEELTAETGTMGTFRGYVVNIPTGVTVDSNTKITITATETVASTPSESTGESTSESTDGQ